MPNSTPPTEEELNAAPVLSRWRCEAGDLIGVVTGHPNFDPQSVVRTSLVVDIDEAAGWARTQNRVYRLGVHMAETLN